MSPASGSISAPSTCERKVELCNEPLGGYLLTGTPTLVYNLSNGTRLVYRQYFLLISAKTNLSSRIGSLRIRRHTLLHSAQQPVRVWQLLRTGAQSLFASLTVGKSSRVRGIHGSRDSCAVRPAAHASLLRQACTSNDSTISKVDQNRDIPVVCRQRQQIRIQRKYAVS